MLAHPEQAVGVAETLFIGFVSMLRSDRTGTTHIAPTIAVALVAMVRASPQIRSTLAIVHSHWACVDTRLGAIVAGSEGPPQGTLCHRAERLPAQEQRCAQAHPRPEVGVQQQADDRGHGAEPRHLGELREVKGTAIVRVDRRTMETLSPKLI